ncbi:hypothetical protein [Streptomyces sp. A012304]|uniref:hypothetical protein n=1 Tax=Streptomyces sp. A012304 TaxID=375446 RepID=UPI002230AB81|nr:hypothetical protein [Streptomyces sp. A012304]GKQ41833.1 hypothetical protein ALMP_83460 [Streptomyces sp. A012304]
MKLFRLKKWASSAVALTSLTAGLGIVQAPSAQAAPVYWTFLNNSPYANQCLTGGQVNSQGTGKAYMSWCSESFSQQWDWRGSDTTAPYFLQLQNRATGLCLATDAKSETNAVWTSPCEWRPGMRFRYEYNDVDVSGPGGSLCVNLTVGANYYCLRTSPNEGAVYSSGWWTGDWFGSHS